MKAFPATVKYVAGEPKDFGYGPKIDVVFETSDPGALAAMQRHNLEKLRVNAKAGTSKATALQALTKGQSVLLVAAGETSAGKPYFDLVESPEVASGTDAMASNGAERWFGPAMASESPSEKTRHNIDRIVAIYVDLCAAFAEGMPSDLTAWMPEADQVQRMAVSLFIEEKRGG